MSLRVCARWRAGTTAGTFPAHSSLQTFTAVLLLPDPDHILPHGGEANILQWAETFVGEAACKSRLSQPHKPASALLLLCCYTQFFMFNLRLQLIFII